MPYKLLPDVATADIAIEITGKDPSELLTSAAQAYIDISVDRKTVKPTVEKRIVLHAENTEKLLFDFLEELIYLKDADYLIYADCSAVVTGKNGGRTCTATLHCASIDPKAQKLKMDVKAVTQHMFEVKEQTDKSWKATVVLDI